MTEAKYPEIQAGSNRRPVYGAIDLLTAALLAVYQLRHAADSEVPAADLAPNLIRLEQMLKELGICLHRIRDQ